MPLFAAFIGLFVGWSSALLMGTHSIWIVSLVTIFLSRTLFKNHEFRVFITIIGTVSVAATGLVLGYKSIFFSVLLLPIFNSLDHLLQHKAEIALCFCWLFFISYAGTHLYADDATLAISLLGVLVAGGAISTYCPYYFTAGTATFIMTQLPISNFWYFSAVHIIVSVFCILFYDDFIRRITWNQAMEAYATSLIGLACVYNFNWLLLTSREVIWRIL